MGEVPSTHTLGPGLDLQHSEESQHGGLCLEFPHWKVETGDSLELIGQMVSQSMSFRFSERPCLKKNNKKTEKGIYQKSALDLYIITHRGTHVHIHAHTCIHMYM